MWAQNELHQSQQENFGQSVAIIPALHSVECCETTLSFWHLPEDWNTYQKLRAFRGLLEGLIFILPKSKCWQERANWGSLKTKANVCASTYILAVVLPNSAWNPWRKPPTQCFFLWRERVRSCVQYSSFFGSWMKDWFLPHLSWNTFGARHDIDAWMPLRTKGSWAFCTTPENFCDRQKIYFGGLVLRGKGTVMHASNILALWELPKGLVFVLSDVEYGWATDTLEIISLQRKKGEQDHLRQLQRTCSTTDRHRWEQEIINSPNRKKRKGRGKKGEGKVKEGRKEVTKFWDLNSLFFS